MTQDFLELTERNYPMSEEQMLEFMQMGVEPKSEQEMKMEQFNKMLEMAQNNPQMLAMLQQTLNKGAEQQKHDNYFANDEAAPTQSKGRGR